MIESNMFGAVFALGAGAAVAAMNYGISRYVLKRHASKYVATQFIRQLTQITFLILLYVLGGYTPWDRIWLLVGGCLGMTLPMIWFTCQLVKLNDSLHGKEDSTDG